jgi:hypothetical protein
VSRIWSLFRGWFFHSLYNCPVCGRRYNAHDDGVGQVVLESWPHSWISAPTCCPGTFYDCDYVAHENDSDRQVNPKPIPLIVVRP